MTEARLTAACIQLAELAAKQGCILRWHRLNAGLARSVNGKGIIKLAEAGTPDWLFFFRSTTTAPWPMVPIYIEFKAPGKKPSKVQTEWHATAKKQGFRIEVVCSVEHFLAICQAFGFRGE